MKEIAAGAKRLTLLTLVGAGLAAAGAALGGWLGLTVAMRRSYGGADIGWPVIYPAAAIAGAVLGVVVVLSGSVLVAVVLRRLRGARD